MTCTATEFGRAILLAAVLAGGVPAIYGQSPPAMQEILERLDRLEKNNEALLEQVRALRQEISELKGPVAQAAPAPAAPAGEQPPPPEQPNVADRLAVQESRTEELAQTKVEASQKFPIRITGMALFNASLNGRYNNNADNPVTASLAPGDLTGDGTLRQSTIGLLFNGPQNFSGRQGERITVHGFLRRLHRIAGSLVPPPDRGDRNWTGPTPASCLARISRSFRRAIRIRWRRWAFRRSPARATCGCGSRRFAWSSDFPWATPADSWRRRAFFKPADYDFPMNASLYSPPLQARQRNTRGRALKAVWSCGIAGATRSAWRLQADSITTAIAS